MAKTDLNLRATSKKRNPILSLAYLDRTIDQPTDRLETYLTKTRRPTIRRDLIHLTTELIGSAREKKLRTTELTKLKNKLARGEVDLKNYFEFKKITKELIKRGQPLANLTASASKELFAESKFTTKTGKLRKRGRLKRAKNIELTAKRLSARARRVAAQQLAQVIALALKHDGLWNRALANNGVVDYVEPYAVSHITTTLNYYVVGYDLLSEIFASYEWLPDGGLGDAKLTTKAYLIAKRIAMAADTGSYSLMGSLFNGRLQRNAPAVRIRKKIKKTNGKK